jgi:putative ABC transport system permease protein
MKLAWRELRRRPGRFGVALGALTFLALLLLFLGALLDGLFLGQTGAIRSQPGEVVVYSAASRDSFLRSMIPADLRRIVQSTKGVTQLGGLGFAQTTAVVPGKSEVADVAVVGFELAPIGMPKLMPQSGEAYADRRLEGFGVRPGQTLKVGIGGTPIRIIGWIEDTSYQLQGALWTTPATWRTVAGSVPDRFVPDGDFQALVVRTQSSGANAVSAKELATRIDAKTARATSSLTKSEAELSLPGIKQQNGVFNGIISTTFVVAVLVVALFFALLTLERIPLYGVLKAMGSSSRQLFGGVVLQAVVITVVAFAISAPMMILLSRNAPAELPIQLTNARLISTIVGLSLAAVLGSMLSLRRVVRTDPASAIGA